MIPAPVKTYSRKANQSVAVTSSISYRDESEKENEGIKTRRRSKKTGGRKNGKKEALESATDANVSESPCKSEDLFDELLSSPLKQEVKFKPLSFWGNKVKSLEEGKKEKKKLGLYELSDFSDSDESYTAERKKKVKKKKPAAKKKKDAFNNVDFNKLCSKKKKVKSKETVKPHEGMIIKERVLLTKEKEKLKDKGELFTFDKTSSLMGITSTPAAKRNEINLVGTSKFSFYSPILKPEEGTPCVTRPDFDISSIHEESVTATPKFKKIKKMVSESEDVDSTLQNETIQERGSKKLSNCESLNVSFNRFSRECEEPSVQNITIIRKSSNEFLGFESKDLVQPSFLLINDLEKLNLDNSDADTVRSEISVPNLTVKTDESVNDSEIDLKNEASFKPDGSNCSFSSNKCDHLTDKLDSLRLTFHYLRLLRPAKYLAYKESYRIRFPYLQNLRSYKSTDSIFDDSNYEEKYYLSDNDCQRYFVNNEDENNLSDCVEDVGDRFSDELKVGPSEELKNNSGKSFESEELEVYPEELKNNSAENSEEDLKSDNHTDELEVRTSEELENNLGESLDKSKDKFTSPLEDSYNLEQDFSRNITIRRRYPNFSKMEVCSVKNTSEESKLYETAIGDISNISVKEGCSQYRDEPKGSDSSEVDSSPEPDKTFRKSDSIEENYEESTATQFLSFEKTLVAEDTPTKPSPEDREFIEMNSSNKILSVEDPFLSSPVPIFESSVYEPKSEDLESTRINYSRRNKKSDWNLSRISIMPPISESKNLELESTVADGMQNFSVKLIPGKKWRRSVAVIHHLQNHDSNDGSSRGRNYMSFVKEITDMQPAAFQESIMHPDNDVSKSSSTINNLTRRFSNMKILNRSAKVLEESNDESDCSLANVTAVEDVTVRENEELTAREDVLMRCNQTEPLSFSENFNEKTLKNCKKIGEGVYGEVFVCNGDTVLKIIPIEGDFEVNGDRQKKFEEVRSEIVTAMELSNLRNGTLNRCSGFNELKRCWCVTGEYPDYLIKLWEDYDRIGNGSDNENPRIFGEDQLYIILELAHGGQDLEAFVFNSATESYSALLQTVYSLAVAEEELQFEHRDLHWGNLLIKRTEKKSIDFLINGVTHSIPSKGVEVSIIDFTLSRLTFQGCCLFNDLSVDPTLFTSVGDYQFEIYRLMKNEVRNDWSLFRPKTNIFWLHYLSDKMVEMARYKKKTTGVHKKGIESLKTFRDIILNSQGSGDFILKEMGE